MNKTKIKMTFGYCIIKIYICWKRI